MNNKTKLQEAIEKLKMISGHQVRLIESNEGVKNATLEFLRRISEDLDTTKNDIIIALEKLQDLPGQDKAKVSLKGLQAMINSGLVDVTELISDITSLESTNISEALTIDPDELVNNLDTVKKLEDKQVDIEVKDDDEI